MEQFYYPNYIERNKKLEPLLIEWSETQEDRRKHGTYITFFQLEHSWHSPDNLHELEAPQRPALEIRTAETMVEAAVEAVFQFLRPLITIHQSTLSCYAI